MRKKASKVGNGENIDSIEYRMHVILFQDEKKIYLKWP